MLCDKTKQCTADILIPHERPITLSFLTLIVVGGRLRFDRFSLITLIVECGEIIISYKHSYEFQFFFTAVITHDVLYGELYIVLPSITLVLTPLKISVLMSDSSS